MDARTELKIIAKKHRWAFEELTFDCCMMASNKLDGKWKEQFDYLKTRFGSGNEVLARALAELPLLKIPQPAGTRKEQLKKVVRYHSHVFDTLTVEEKEKEAVELIDDIHKMYGFLLREYGSALSITECLKWLILTQYERRKTMYLFESYRSATGLRGRSKEAMLR